MANKKELVRLREKEISHGCKSLYLDINHNGERKKVYLKMYLVKENTKEDREQNKITLRIAQSIQAKMILDINSGDHNVLLSERQDVRFFDFYDRMREQLESRKNRLWQAVRIIILDYCRNELLTFRNIDVTFVSGLRDYIDKKEHRAEAKNGQGLSHGTKNIYWAIIKAVFNKAVREGIIDKSPAINIQGFKPSEPKRTYLTASEVRAMAQTECSHADIKKAFLFSCLTGLRYSDVVSLTWGDVSEENGYTRITFRQKKTKWQEYLDINNQATSLMGERQANNQRVFNLTLSVNQTNIVIREWAKESGVTKHISFHVARHTFATMMLSNGIDLYTVSKLVGHRNISTTQIYAKIMDKDKQRAVDTMPSLLG